MYEIKCFFELLDRLGCKLSDEEKIFAELKAYIADKLITYRNENMLTQAKLAKLLGISKEKMEKLETGEINLSLKTIARIMARLDDVYIPIDKRIKAAEERVARAKEATDWEIQEMIYSPSTKVAILIGSINDKAVDRLHKLAEKPTGEEFFKWLEEAGLEPVWLVNDE